MLRYFTQPIYEAMESISTDLITKRILWTCWHTTIRYWCIIGAMSLGLGMPQKSYCPPISERPTQQTAFGMRPNFIHNHKTNQKLVYGCHEGISRHDQDRQALNKFLLVFGIAILQQMRGLAKNNNTKLKQKRPNLIWVWLLRRTSQSSLLRFHFIREALPVGLSSVC